MLGQVRCENTAAMTSIREGQAFCDTNYFQVWLAGVIGNLAPCKHLSKLIFHGYGDGEEAQKQMIQKWSGIVTVATFC